MCTQLLKPKKKNDFTWITESNSSGLLTFTASKMWRSPLLFKLLVTLLSWGLEDSCKSWDVKSNKAFTSLIPTQIDKQTKIRFYIIFSEKTITTPDQLIQILADSYCGLDYLAEWHLLISTGNNSHGQDTPMLTRLSLIVSPATTSKWCIRIFKGYKH